MGARWYGQFTYADTAQVNPVPDPAAANPFAYADPTGHRVIDLPGEDPDPEAAAAVINQAQAYAVLPNPSRKAALAAAIKAENQAEARAAAKKAALNPRDRHGAEGNPCSSNISYCEYKAYRASGGQINSRGIPTGKGYAPRH